jgi:hypothetical protein
VYSIGNRIKLESKTFFHIDELEVCFFEDEWDDIFLSMNGCRIRVMLENDEGVFLMACADMAINGVSDGTWIRRIHFPVVRVLKDKMRTRGIEKRTGHMAHKIPVDWRVAKGLQTTAGFFIDGAIRRAHEFDLHARNISNEAGSTVHFSTNGLAR